MTDPSTSGVLAVAATSAVTTLTLNRPDALNALTAELRRELLAALKAAGRDPEVRAVVITGAGRAFCAGADLRGGSGERDFRRVLTNQYNPLIEAIRALPKPVIAAVNGVAAGAGVSLALAADLVIAAEDAKFVSAFHRIGLVPDSGLTRTLVRAVGRHRAFEILMGERQLAAAEAHAAGLVAAVVPGERLAEAARELAERLASGPTVAIGLTKRLIADAEDATLSDSLTAEAALQDVAGRTEDHAEGVAAFSEKRARVPRPMTDIATVGVLGAGVMGAGIAQVAAEAGLEVLLHDPLDGASDRALERIGGFLQRKADKEQLTVAEADAARGRIRATGKMGELARADAVIEAIPEKLKLKRDAFRRLDADAAPGVILASNTSSLSIAQIATATDHPERVIGMHFFNPVPLMALVEIIPGPMTLPEVVERVDELARRLAKTPVVAADTPGFIVNRVQRALYLEAFRIFEEGVADVSAIDDAMRQLGFRLGPFELADVVGTDVNLAAGTAIFEGYYGDPRYRPAQVQRRVVDAERFGRKSGAGYYDYAADGSRGGPWSALLQRPAGAPSLPAIDAAQIGARVLAAIVNEAASAVEDGVAAPHAIDVAMRLASNWPDGPIAWGERIGLASVVHTLDALHAAVPDGRYRATPLLRALVMTGGSFFGELA